MPPPHSPDRGRNDEYDRDRNRQWSVRDMPYNNGHDGRQVPSHTLPGSSGGTNSSVWGQPSNPYYSNTGPASSSRRSRSPENDRMRQSSTGGRSYRPVESYFPQSDHVEPGQILSPSFSHNPISIPFTNNNPPPRDPRAGMPTGPGYSRAPPPQNQPTSQYRPGRKVSSDRPNDGGRSPLAGGPSSNRDTLAPSAGSVMGALENFSKAMHSTLITTSQHALAFKHFSRLTTSNVVNQNSATYEEAEKRVNKAQKVVDEQMILLQSSYTELIRRTIGITSSSSESISALELDGLKERMRKIEDLTSSSKNSRLPLPQPEAPPPPPPESSPRPPTPTLPSTTTTTTTSRGPITSEEKKRKVGAILDDIISRLEKLEDMKNDFDSRIDEIETVQMTSENDYLDRESRINQLRNYGGWSSLEDRRDPQGTIRGLKRKEREVVNGDQDEDPTVTTSRVRLDENEDEDVVMGGNGRGELVESLQKDIERLSDEVKALKTQLDNSTVTTNNPGASLQPILDQLNAQQKSKGSSVIHGHAIVQLTPSIGQNATSISTSSSTANPTAALGNIMSKLTSQSSSLNASANIVPSASTTTPNSASATLGNMMSHLNSQRQSLTAQTSDTVDTNQINELKTEISKLSEQIKVIQSTAQPQNNGISTFTNSNPTINGNSQTDLINIRNTINSIQNVINKLTIDIKTLLTDKESRLGIFEKIQIGVSNLAENIQKCRKDYLTLNELSKSSSAIIISHTESLKGVMGDIEWIKNEIKLLKPSIGSTDKGKDKEKDREISELKESIKVLQAGLKEMREGREEWTKQVMAACLDSMKEENESRKEDYSKIARREIQNTIKDFMTKRSASTSSTTSTSQPNRSNSEPMDHNVPPGISPSIPPTTISGNSLSVPPPNSISPGITSQSLSPLSQDGTSNSLASRINAISPIPPIPATQANSTSAVKPTLSDRMSSTSVNSDQLVPQAQSYPLKDRLTGENPNTQIGDGVNNNNMDIDGN